MLLTVSLPAFSARGKAFLFDRLLNKGGGEPVAGSEEVLVFSWFESQKIIRLERAHTRSMILSDEAGQGKLPPPVYTLLLGFQSPEIQIAPRTSLPVTISSLEWASEVTQKRNNSEQPGLLTPL